MCREKRWLMNGKRYSRQRELIYEALRQTEQHPTAEMIYQWLKPANPSLSLGTVYRNLNLLVELGEIQKLRCGDGADHFDGDTSPHHHFICRECGCIKDLPLSDSENINQMAQQYVDGTVDSHITYFYGVCGDCLRKTS